MGRQTNLKVGIIGGSIAGCTAAIELSRAGHDVTIFERSHGELRGRGAGIGTPIPIMEKLVERDLVDANMPYFLVQSGPHVGKAVDKEPYGHTAWSIHFPIALLNWGDLYRNLRKRVRDSCYRQGQEVVDIRMDGPDTAVLTMADGQEHAFDLVICADGYYSLGREKICPDSRLDYRGYVLWRGTLSGADLADCEPLEGKLQRVGYREGHAVFYFVPGVNGSVEPNERWVNWAVYVRVADAELAEFLTDRDGKQRYGSLAPGRMSLEHEADLKQLARDHLPGYFGDIIGRSVDTFVQAIYMVSVPAYHVGRICLAGDAGAVAPPFTASGVYKGMNNAIDLTEALQEHATVDDALAAWGARETATGQRMAALGRRLEQALIWQIPDFSQMQEEEMRAWWENAAKMPEDMFQEASR